MRTNYYSTFIFISIARFQQHTHITAAHALRFYCKKSTSSTKIIRFGGACKPYYFNLFFFRESAQLSFLLFS